MTELHNINDALKYYRYYAAFCSNAIDVMEWYIDGCKINSWAKSITESRALTLTFLAHMKKALETYEQLCMEDGKIRRCDIIKMKYVNPEGGSDGKGRPYTDEQLAVIFGCSDDTIKRDLKEGKKCLGILFFGYH